MTSRGRKAGDPLDRYDTDPDVVRRFLRAWKPDPAPKAIWEPSAGAGNMLAPLREAFPEANIAGSDIAPRSDEVLRKDFLELGADPGRVADLIFTNPPFRLAEQFARHAMSILRPDRHLVLLLRAGFLESVQRWNFFEQYMPEQVWFLRSRPKFTGPNTDGESTDMALYAWFVWRKGHNPDHFEGRFV